MIVVREVKTKKEIKDFLNFPIKLYKGNEYFVPCLYGDELKMFKPNYMYYDQSEAKFWNAYEDDKMVGRIGAILQKASNKKWNQKRVRFTHFDSVDDKKVAKALFDEVEKFAKERGMKEICGPLGFSDLDREGLLIEGFDQKQTFEEQYNFPYYQSLIESCGYSKDVDWIEHRLTLSDETEKMIMLKDRLLERSGLTLVPVMSFKKACKLYGDQFFELLDISYDKLYGTVPFTDGMKKLLMENFAPIVNPNYLRMVVDKDNKLVAFVISFPGISEVFRKSNGHIYPWILPELLHTVKHPKVIDLGLVGVVPGQNLTGAVAILYGEMARQMKKDKIEYLETNLNLEDNQAIIGTWKHFNSIQHKRRRSFVKKI
ncbi:MAG: hypothetical protein MJ248_03170 [Bacilli bacterium]|nr:hypothetical protein [Bacilli bacterium]